MVYLGLALIALPFGWMLGVLAAFVVAGGSDIGQTPMLTVPPGILIGLLAAFVPWTTPAARLKALSVATLAIFAFFSIFPL